MKKHIGETEFKERWGLWRTGKGYRGKLAQILKGLPSV